MAPRRGAAGWLPHGLGLPVGPCRGRPLLFEGVLDNAMGTPPAVRIPTAQHLVDAGLHGGVVRAQGLLSGVAASNHPQPGADKTLALKQKHTPRSAPHGPFVRISIAGNTPQTQSSRGHVSASGRFSRETIQICAFIPMSQDPTMLRPRGPRGHNRHAPLIWLAIFGHDRVPRRKTPYHLR